MLNLRSPFLCFYLLLAAWPVMVKAQLTPLEEPVIWVTSTNVASSGSQGGLIKVSGGNVYWNGDAVSAGTQRMVRDGSLSFKAAAASSFGIGLSLIDDGRSYTDIEFCIRINNDNTARVYHGSTPGAEMGVYDQDTVFTIRRKGAVVEYLKDGVLGHTSAIPCAGIMMADCSILKLESGSGTRLLSAYLFNGDADTDGMPDSWEKSYLPLYHHDDDVLAFLPEGDADGDGASNLEEFQDGSNPRDVLSYLHPVVWQSRIGTELVPGSEGGLVKTGAAGWNADAASSQEFLADGKLVFMVPAGSNLIVGLTRSNDGRSDTDLEYGIQVTAAGTASARRPEASGNFNLGDYTAETVFAIQRVNGRVQFLKDDVLIFTSEQASSGPLKVDCSLNAAGSQVSMARIYTGDLDADGLPDAWELDYLPEAAVYADLQAFTAEGDADSDGLSNEDEFMEGTHPLQPYNSPDPLGVVWQPSSITNLHLTADEGGIEKVAGSAAWTNADAVGDKKIFQTGRLNFQIKTGSYMAVGLTHDDDSRSYTDLEYCIRVNLSNEAEIFEGSAKKADMGVFDDATRFAIRRVGAHVEFLRDGVVYYKSAVPVTSELMVDCSFQNVGSKLTLARLYTGDLDQDGIPDEWEIRQLLRILPGGVFPTFENLRDDFLPSQVGNEPGDEDGDGDTNLQEYFSGTDPLQQVSYRQTITWTELVNTSSQGINLPGSLMKSTGGSGFNADAFSDELLDGDGTLTFSVSPAGSMAVGLTDINNNHSYTDLEYAFRMTEDGAAVQRPETGTNLDIGSYTADTVFGIRRKDATIEYMKDGVIVYTSTTPSYGNLYADCSINTLDKGFRACYEL